MCWTMWTLNSVSSYVPSPLMVATAIDAEAAAQPGDRAARRPPVATGTQLAHPPQVEPRGEHQTHRQHRVEPALHDQPADVERGQPGGVPAGCGQHAGHPAKVRADLREHARTPAGVSAATME